MPQSTTQRFNWRRVAKLLGAGLIVFSGICWSLGVLPNIDRRLPANSIMVISPYEYEGTWVFDDPRVGLHREPFVVGIPEMIDALVADIPNASDGFRLIFSTRAFPGYQKKLTWLRGDRDGNYYALDESALEGWLCPAMFKYYAEAPSEIYVKAESSS